MYVYVRYRERDMKWKVKKHKWMRWQVHDIQGTKWEVNSICTVCTTVYLDIAIGVRDKIGHPILWMMFAKLMPPIHSHIVTVFTFEKFIHICTIQAQTLTHTHTPHLSRIKSFSGNLDFSAKQKCEQFRNKKQNKSEAYFKTSTFCTHTIIIRNANK